MKLGHGSNFERVLTTYEEVEAWYQDGRGDPEAVAALDEFIRDFLPELQVLSVTGGACVTANVSLI